MGLFSRRPASPPLPPKAEWIFEAPDPNWVPPSDLISLTPADLADMTNAQISAYKLALDSQIERYKEMEAEQKGKPDTIANLSFTTRILRARSACYEQISAINFERVMRGQLEVPGIEPRRIGHNGRPNRPADSWSDDRMALFGLKSAPIPPLSDRPALPENLASELTQVGWQVEGESVLVRRIALYPDSPPLRVRFGPWNDRQYAAYMQIGKASSDDSVPYPYTRVKVLPYGFTNFGTLLVLVRLYGVSVIPSAAEGEQVAQKMSRDMWGIRNQAKNYGPIG